MRDFDTMKVAEYRELVARGDPEALAYDQAWKKEIQKEIINSHTFMGDMWVIAQPDIEEEIKAEAAERIVNNYFAFNQIIVSQRRSIVKKAIGQVLYGQTFQEEWDGTNLRNLYLASFDDEIGNTEITRAFQRMRYKMGLLAEEYYFDGDKLDDRKLKGGKYASIIAYYDETEDSNATGRKQRPTDLVNSLKVEGENYSISTANISTERPVEEYSINDLTNKGIIADITAIVGKDQITFIENYTDEENDTNSPADHSKMYRIRRKIEKKRQIFD